MDNEQALPGGRDETPHSRNLTVSPGGEETTTALIPEPYTRQISSHPRHSSNTLSPTRTEHNLQVTLMDKARGESSFAAEELTNVIHGSKQAADIIKATFARVEEALGATDMSKLPTCYYNSNQQVQLLEGFRAGKITFEDDRENGTKHFEFSTHTWTLANSNPLGMTRALFVPSVRLQGTDEQIAHWVPLAESGRIVATYVQTELAHGTFVGGVQTTATLDLNTDEFIINTPCVEATKFWPGAVGYACTHIFLVARMIIAEKDFGVHSFVVQIRSMEDFKPLPGIELGDIGTKMAYNTIDNGYISFHNVRIPRTNKLMRFSQVSREGTYTSSPLREKLLYGGMLKGRTLLIQNAPFKLAQALTIATRYSTIRLQGRSLAADAPHETPIIAYKHQQHRLLTLIAKSYVMLFVSRQIMGEYAEVTEAQLKGNHARLPLIHMRMAGVKAWTCQAAADGAEDARKMCGGHGYMMISGLGEIVSSAIATCTFEGENYVMWGQVGKYIWKSLGQKRLPADLAYVSRYLQDPQRADGKFALEGDDFFKPDTQIAMYERRAAMLALDACEAVSKSVQAGVAPLRAENDHALELLQAGKAHIELYILVSSYNFISRLKKSSPPTSPHIIALLHELTTLWALSNISSPFSLSSTSFFETLSLSPAQLSTLRRLVDDLVEKLAPDAIALTDAWDFTDASLGSAIGCKDGDAYRRTMSWVKQLAINVDAAANGGVMKGTWEGYVKPLIRSRL